MFTLLLVLFVLFVKGSGITEKFRFSDSVFYLLRTATRNLYHSFTKNMTIDYYGEYSNCLFLRFGM